MTTSADPPPITTTTDPITNWRDFWAEFHRMQGRYRGNVRSVNGDWDRMQVFISKQQQSSAKEYDILAFAANEVVREMGIETHITDLRDSVSRLAVSEQSILKRLVAVEQVIDGQEAINADAIWPAIKALEHAVAERWRVGCSHYRPSGSSSTFTGPNGAVFYIDGAVRIDYCPFCGSRRPE